MCGDKRKEYKMSEIYQCIIEELGRLQKEIQLLDAVIKNYPKEELLEVHDHKTYVQYYYRKRCSSDRKQYSSDQKHCSSNQKQCSSEMKSKKEAPTYIRKENLDFAKTLAQRDYDQKIQCQLKKCYKVMKKAQQVYQNLDLPAVYEKMCEGKKKLIKPRFVSPEMYAREWQTAEYTGKPFAAGDPEIYTVRGERVRSKSEKILADLFERKGIPYRYEYPLKLSGGRVIVYPDFCVLNKRTGKEYWFEHLGRMDDPEYVKKALFKLDEMQRHGIFPGKNLLITYETKNKSLNTAAAEALIREYLL